MKIDLKKPIVSSLFSIFITFLISMMVLFIIKPSFIIDISKEGKKKKNIYLLFTYSMLFGVSAGIIVLLCKTTEVFTTKPASVLSFNSNAYKPVMYSSTII